MCEICGTAGTLIAFPVIGSRTLCERCHSAAEGGPIAEITGSDWLTYNGQQWQRRAAVRDTFRRWAQQAS